MSLRLRLVLLTLLLVAAVAVTLSAVQLRAVIDSLSRETIGRAELAGERVNSFLVEYLNQRTAQLPSTASAEETIAAWRDSLASDPEVVRFLGRTLRYSEALLQINVLDSRGIVVVSNDAALAGRPKAPHPSFADWSRLPWYQRVYDVLSRRPEWEISARPIGIPGGAQPVLEIQVVASSFLLRPSLISLLGDLAAASGGALLVALALAWAATHSALRPLQRIERTIDRIAQGNFQAGEPPAGEAKEFRAVESKLDTLGQKIAAGRSPGETLDVLVEQVATQLDVATRLAAISRLTSGVAHEIKNPLNAILLRLDLLKARLAGADEEIAQELEVLSREVLRLNRVVTTFLDFSRPVEVHFTEVDLGALVREMAELIRPQAEEANIRIEVDTPGAPALLRGDPDLLKQAVLNLMTNAVEAMAAAGGQLRLTVSRTGRRWLLEVADTGPGIPEALRGKVFQLYFTSKARGSGIGLAMAYRAAQLHNGTISFTSETGRGTTFRLELPALGAHG
jgi:signal transduction histidine kinase